MLQRVGGPPTGSPGGVLEQKGPPTRSRAAVGTAVSEAQGPWVVQVAVTMVATRAPQEQMGPLPAQQGVARPARSGCAATSSSVSLTTKTRAIYCQLHQLPWARNRGSLHPRSPVSPTTRTTKPADGRSWCPPVGQRGGACVGGGGGAASASGIPSVDETAEGLQRCLLVFPTQKQRRRRQMAIQKCYWRRIAHDRGGSCGCHGSRMKMTTAAGMRKDRCRSWWGPMRSMWR